MRLRSRENCASRLLSKEENEHLARLIGVHYQVSLRIYY